MSKRTQPTIEEFDDDTDLPLPSAPLPETGSKGALLQSVDSDSEDDDEEEDDDKPRKPFDPNPGPASPPGSEKKTITDITPYKRWTCIYPIYIDAKRRYGVGARRIARSKAVWWPLSKDIAEATSRLGLSTLHEVQKFHPSDWDNPGRVRVQWKRDGQFVNERIKTKKMLLEAIAFYIRSVKPELIPKPPFNYKPPHPTPATHAKKQVTSKSTAKPSSKDKEKEKKTKKKSPLRRLPQPPEPRPQLASSVSAYSPALPSGVLVETVKAGMNAAAAENANAPPGSGKGKRKVVRVRA